MEPADLLALARLIRTRRWAAIATLSGGAPLASMVAYAPAEDFSEFLFHLSRLSEHTRNLIEDPRASLCISEPDNGEGDPQLLARVTLRGEVTPEPTSSAAFDELRARYVARFPSAERRFGFGDFLLFRFVPAQARFVEGFARSHTMTSGKLAAAAALLGAEEAPGTGKGRAAKGRVEPGRS